MDIDDVLEILTILSMDKNTVKDKEELNTSGGESCIIIYWNYHLKNIRTYVSEHGFTNMWKTRI